jgi:hypothetical protein
VREATVLAAGRDMRVLRGRAVPGSGAAAFRPLTEAFAPLAPELDAGDDLAPWLPALAVIIPTLTTLRTPSTSPRRCGASRAAPPRLGVPSPRWASEIHDRGAERRRLATR